MMLLAAFTGFMANVTLSEPQVSPALQAAPVRLTLAVAVALLTGGLLGLLHAVLSIQYKVDQIVSGTVINILALGLTGYFYRLNAPTLGKLPNLIDNPFGRDSSVELKLADNLTLYLPYDIGRIIFDKDLITYLTLVIVFVLGWALFHTTWGLRTRSIGENPRGGHAGH